MFGSTTLNYFVSRMVLLQTSSSVSKLGITLHSSTQTEREVTHQLVSHSVNKQQQDNRSRNEPRMLYSFHSWKKI